MFGELCPTFFFLTKCRIKCSLIVTLIQQTQQASVGGLWDWQPVLRGPLQFPFLLGADCRRRLARKKRSDRESWSAEAWDSVEQRCTAFDSSKHFIGNKVNNKVNRTVADSFFYFWTAILAQDIGVWAVAMEGCACCLVLLAVFSHICHFLFWILTLGEQLKEGNCKCAIGNHALV